MGGGGGEVASPPNSLLPRVEAERERREGEGMGEGGEKSMFKHQEYVDGDL
jgi:hypothetical protein